MLIPCSSHAYPTLQHGIGMGDAYVVRVWMFWAVQRGDMDF